MIGRLQISGILSIMLVFALTTTAHAHNTQPRLEISLERLHPGEVVDVRGVGFGTDDTVTLTLLGSGVEMPLAEIIANAEGEFLHIAVLPADLTDGTYYFRAVASHHFVLSPPLTVWGTAVAEGGGQGPRDEEDGLLAPMPTFPPAVATVSAPVVSEPREELPAASGMSTNLLALAVLMIVVFVFAFGYMRKRTTS